MGKLSAKDFAKKFAGEYYMFRGKRVRIVGYYRRGSGRKPIRLIVTGLRGGWKYEYLKDSPEHVFTARVQAATIWYADINELNGYYPL